MRKRERRPDAEDFFRSAFTAGFIGLLVAGMVCGTVSCGRQDIKNGSMRYKNAVFMGAAGKNFPLDRELTSIDTLGRCAGAYLKDAVGAGIGLKEGISYLLRARINLFCFCPYLFREQLLEGF